MSEPIFRYPIGPKSCRTYTTEIFVQTIGEMCSNACPLLSGSWCMLKSNGVKLKSIGVDCGTRYLRCEECLQAGRKAENE